MTKSILFDIITMASVTVSIGVKMKQPKDSTGKPIKIGDKVRFRGQIYTIKEFKPYLGLYDTCAISFEETQHVPEIADEIKVDLIKEQ